MKNQRKFIWLSVVLILSLFIWDSPQTAQAQDGSGGTITHLNGYTIHTFTSNGTFNPGPYVSSVDVLVVGGGGGGGGVIGGGGGGGGVVYSPSFTVTPSQNYPVTVGAGGVGGQGWIGSLSGNRSGNNGQNSSFSTITAVGGGGGASNGPAGNGGSSGGGGFNWGVPGTATSGQGNVGGSTTDAGNKGAGGGGSAGVGGNTAACQNGGNGAQGVANTISGSTIYYGGGGGGGVRFQYDCTTGYPNAYSGGIGGLGGGGDGSNKTFGATSGTQNKGGGGGGAGYDGDTDSVTAGSGGAGVVIIRYLTPTLATPTCSSASPDNDWTIANTGIRQTFAYGVANATDVYFPTWSGTTAAEQDDIVWYHLGAGVTNLGGGTWRADVNLANHPGLGTITSYAYLWTTYSGFVPCDNASFTRLNNGTINVNVTGNPGGASWKIECTLTNPTCPNVPAGSTGTSFPTKPYSTWTITPVDIPGYDWQVTGCSVNTPCSQMFP